MNVSEDCIEDCKNGKREAQKALYDQALPYLSALCTRYLFDQSFRKDLLQEAFISIFKNIDQFDSEKGEFKSWSGRILINYCLKHNGKRKDNLFTLPEKTPEQFSSPEVLEKMSCEEIIKILKKMPKSYYEVFNLYVVDGFSHIEISKLIGVSVGLSKKRLSRARQWLKSNPDELEEHLNTIGISIN